MNYYKNIIRNLRLIVKCGICSHHQKIEFHHIKSTKVNGMGRGSSNRHYDIVKHPDCYIPLCYFCHQKVTSEEIIIHQDKIEIMSWSSDCQIGGDIHVI